MAFIPKANTNQGMFVPTTVIYDALRILEVDKDGKGVKESLKRLYQSMNIVSLAINAREIGYYPQEEFVIGNLYYNTDPNAINDLRPIIRRTYDTGPIPAGTTTIPHGLTIEDTWQFVHIYGAANDSVTHVYYSISSGGDPSVTANAANIVITNGTGVSFTSGSIVLEYTKIGGV